jgi:hypothetical protein
MQIELTRPFLDKNSIMHPRGLMEWPDKWGKPPKSAKIPEAEEEADVDEDDAQPNLPLSLDT